MRLRIITTLLFTVLLLVNYNTVAQSAVGYWKFDSGEGTRAIDNSGQNNNAIITGAEWCTGKINSALKFNGKDNRVEINNSAGLFFDKQVTISLWMYATDLSKDWITLLHRTSEKFNWFDFQLYARAKDSKSGYRPVFRVNWNDDQTISPDEEVEAGIVLDTCKWYFITCTYDGNDMKFYINGELSGVTEKSNGVIPEGGRDIWIGGNDKWGEYFTGIIDEVLICNYAMNQSEIAQLMQTGSINYQLQTEVLGEGMINREPNKENYYLGEKVKLSVQPADGWEFAGWEGGLTGINNPVELIIKGKTIVSARFNQNTTVDVEDKDNIINNYALFQNYPNPFNPSTIISYQIPSDAFVTLKIYDALGREVSTLVNEMRRKGKYSVKFSFTGRMGAETPTASGVYIYRLTAGNFSETKKLIFSK